MINLSTGNMSNLNSPTYSSKENWKLYVKQRVLCIRCWLKMKADDIQFWRQVTAACLQKEIEPIIRFVLSLCKYLFYSFFVCLFTRVKFVISFLLKGWLHFSLCVCVCKLYIVIILTFEFRTNIHITQRKLLTIIFKRTTGRIYSKIPQCTRPTISN